MTTIMWFRQDLRLADNPALLNAARQGPVIPVYIRDDTDPRPPGGASRWWLHHSLNALKKSLGGLLFMAGDPRKLLPDLATRTNAGAVFWNRCYDPYSVRRDTDIKARFGEAGIAVESFNGSLLVEPWDIAAGTGEPYKVFTPFWRSASSLDHGEPSAAAKAEVSVPAGLGVDLKDWRLTPSDPGWATGWEKIWEPGEVGSILRLESFVEHGLQGYSSGRDRPDLAQTSRLSPHLHFGEISPRQIFARLDFLAAERPELGRDIEKFRAEIGWREFAHHLLFHSPDMLQKNWKSEFDAYPWRDSDADFDAWKRGMTGYPLVDAGMRELWRTGYMRNRVRMVAASFLTKHLRIHWKRGEAWFRDTLVDADLANNAAGWQWVSGTGADAAPYFRIFNPTTQARKFDPDGDYIRRWCPELARLANADIHAPFEAGDDALEQAGIRLGDTYPCPIIEHARARAAALVGYEEVRKKN